MGQHLSLLSQSVLLLLQDKICIPKLCRFCHVEDMVNYLHAELIIEGGKNSTGVVI